MILLLIFLQILNFCTNFYSKIEYNNFERQTWKLDKIIFGKTKKDTFLISNKDSVYLISFGKMRRNKKCRFRVDIIISLKKEYLNRGTIFYDDIDKKYYLGMNHYDLYKIRKLNKNYGDPLALVLKSFYYSFEDDNTMVVKNARIVSFGEITLFLTKHSKYIKP